MSCNIDYQRDFTRNVELTFHPERWLRPLPKGELCLLGQGSTPHVRFQAEVTAHATKTFAVTLPPGPYRFRTIEAGAEVDAHIGDDGAIPGVVAWNGDILLRSPSHRREFVIHNAIRITPSFFVIEDRAWAKDALTRRARHLHAGLPAALPRTASATRRRSGDRPRRHRLHRPARLDQAL